MTKNISNKLKTLLTLGVVTLATTSSVVPVNALAKNNCTNINTNIKSTLYLYINGVKYKIPVNPGECLKPDFKPNHGNNNNKPIDKPNHDNTNNNNNSTNKPNHDGNNNTQINKPSNFSAYQNQVLDLVNQERIKRGLNKLTLDTKLSNVANIKSQDMVNKNYFDHNSPTYGSPFDMMKKFGINYKSAGENIAQGQKTPQEVMNAWMNSKGHRENILNPNFTKLGVGVAKDNNKGLYWTQMFIG